MNRKEQIERIQYYETILQAAKDGEVSSRQLRELEAYYTSDEWKRDYADDEAGLLPKDLKRGVLSEDGIYNVLEEYKDLLDSTCRTWLEGDPILEEYHDPDR